MNLRLLKFTSLTLSLLIFAVLVDYVSTYYYRFVYWDYIDLTPMLIPYLEGEIDYTKIFALHGNSHWHAFAYLVMLPIAAWTHWQTGYDVALNIAMSCITFFVLMHTLRQRLAETYNKKDIAILTYAILPFVTLFIFSLDQSENWLWGWQVSLFMNLMFSMIALCLLTKPNLSWSGFTSMIISTVVAIYNFSTGYILLPLGLVILWYFHRRTRASNYKFFTLIWFIFLCIMVWRIYDAFAYRQTEFITYYQTETYKLNFIQKTLQHFGNAVTFFPWRYAKEMAFPPTLFVGLTAIATWITLWTVLKKNLSIHTKLFLFAMFTYSLGSALLSSIGRGGVLPRHVSFVSWFWISLTILLTLRCYKFYLEKHYVRFFVPLFYLGTIFLIKLSGNYIFAELYTAKAIRVHEQGLVLKRNYPFTSSSLEKTIHRELKLDDLDRHFNLEPLYNHKLNIFSDSYLAEPLKKPFLPFTPRFTEMTPKRAAKKALKKRQRDG